MRRSPGSKRAAKEGKAAYDKQRERFRQKRDRRLEAERG
jgi:hypothetical protein